MIWFEIILSQLLIIIINSERISQENITNIQSSIHARNKRVTYPEKLMLKVKINGKSHVIQLLPTTQLLANGHLPVWMSSESQDGQFHRLNNIMEDGVGEFSMYHDYCTRSAVVYFHNRKELDGVIKAKYKIEGLHIDTLDEEHEITSKYFRLFNVAKYFRRSCKSFNSVAGEGVQSSAMKVYPELLIAISHDMLKDIEEGSKFPYGVKTISHVITVYNAADMLFRFVKAAEISLNIAGIVIEGADNEWDFAVGTCRYCYVDADKINEQVSEYFRRNENQFSRHSYDYVAYHTRRKLLVSKQVPILGIAIPAGYMPMFYPYIYRSRYNFAVGDLDSLEHYTTIAHELAHVFGAKHDQPVNWFFRPSCDRSIMAKFDCSSSICLKWSDRTEYELGRFFSSPAHCILQNEPRSLHPAAPRKIFTRLEQCQCYGYETFEEPTDDVPGSGCYGSIICTDGEGISNNHLPYPMDGTPCGRQSNRVCWDDECRPVQRKKN